MGSGTSIGRVRGLGSAKEGVQHWWHQKLTAGTNLFLMSWLMISLARLPGYDLAAVRAWVANPWAAIPLLLLIVSVFTHLRLGLQVVIEDYAHAQNRIVALVLLNLFVAATAGTAVFAILKLAIGAAQ